MTFSFNDYEDQYLKDYSGGTPNRGFTKGGLALDAFRQSLKSNTPSSPIHDYSRIPSAPFSAGAGGGGRAVGKVSQGSPAFQPAGPPQRYQVNLLGEAVGALGATAPGQAFLGTQGDQRGGSIPVNFGLGPGVNVATAPVNFQNFATYAREAPLSVITSILGHNYQQPTGGDPYAQPAGPPNNQTIFENMSEADFGGMLDNIIDGVGAVGDAISAPFTAAVDWYRRSDAVNRGKGIRDLALLGSAPGTWLARATSLFDDTRFDWNKLAARAEEQGISQIDLAADLWDLKPEVVQAIFAKPNITDQELEKIVEGEPFSYDPGVNVIVELSANLAPLLLGAGVVRGVGLGGRMVGNVAKAVGGVGAQVAGPARTAAAIERVAPTIARWQMISDAGLIGRPIATAEALGVRTLVRAWRTTKAVGLGLEKFNRYSLMAGTGIRLGEWSLKQAAVTMGNDEAVKVLDQWLWEMPLSNNPGLMLVDGFAVHPLRTAKTIGGAVKRGTTARLFGGGELSVSPIAAKRLGSIADMPLDVVQERLLDRLGWDAAGVSRVFGEDGPLSNTDLKNGLLYFAQQVVRDRHEAALRYLEPEADMVTRSEAFWKAYGDEATKVLQSALTGRGKDADAIVEAVTKEFWERANLTDASELGNEGFIGPYDGNVALSSFAGWIRVSKLAQQVQEGAVVALRPDVNETFLAAFRDRLRTDYTENQTVSATDLNTLRQQVPSAFKVRNGLLKRRGDRVPKVTRRQLEKVLDVLDAEQQLRNLEDARPPTQSVPALRPHEVESRMAIARAFHLRQDTVNKLMDTPPEELAGPVPGDLAKVLADTFKITERDSRTNPATSWAKAAEWWQNTYASAVNRGVALDNVDHFAKIVEDRFQDRNVAAVDKAAFDAIRYGINHPYERFEKLGPTADAIAGQRDLTLTAFTDRMAGWLEDPARLLRTEAAGTTAIVETPLFRAGDATMIEQLAAQAPATSRPEVLAILADPNAHPLEKVDALREAMSDEPMLGTKVQRMRVLELPSLEGAYETMVKDVLGDDALANRDTVTQLTARVQAAEAEFAAIRDEARSLGGIIDRSPTRHLTQEVRDFLDRASVLGGRKIGVGPQGAEAPTWRSLPLDPAGVATVINDVAHQNAIAAAEGRVQQARARLTEIEQRSRLAGVDPNLTEVRWEDAPLEKFPTKKAAKEAAQLAAADGRQYGVSKVGSRWGLFRGERVDRAAAPPEAAQSPAAAGTAQAAPAAEPTRIGTFVDAPEYGPGVERVPLESLRRFMEIDREATPKGGELSVDLDALAQDMVENGVHEPVTLEYDPLTHTAMLTDGNHRLAAAARAGMADLPVKVEIVKRTQTEIDAGQQVLPGFVPVDAEARPGAAQPFALRPSHLLKGPEAPQAAPQAPSAPEAPAVAPEAAPPEKLWQQGGYGVNTEASFFRPQEFDAIAADAPPDAVRLQSGYEWEHVPVDRLDRIPDTNLREMASQILRVAKLADDEVPGFKPKVVKKPARPEHTYKGYGDESVQTIPAEPGYYTFRIDDNNLADQNSLKMGEGDRSGKFPTQEAAKAAMLRWQEQRTAELRQRIAQAKHDAPYIEAELKRRGEGILDSKGNPIMYAGSMQDAGEGYPRLRREAATWSDEELSQRLGQYSERARAVLEQEIERRASGADGLPPIVEQITEAQRVREAQVEQLARETATQLAAAEERAVQYQEGRVLPRGAEPWPTPADQTGMFPDGGAQGVYEPPSIDELIKRLPAPTADKIDELNKLIDASIVGARDTAASSRIADRAVNAAQRALDTKTGAPAAEQARMRKELAAAKRKASSIDRAAEQMWADRADVLEGIKHGINTGRWDATLISAVDQLSGADLVAYIDRAIAELKPKGRLNMGDASRWFNEHFEEIVRKATDMNEASTDPTVGQGPRGQVDPSIRRTIYRKAPTETLKRWLATADPKRTEQITMLNEELVRRGEAVGGGGRVSGRPQMPSEDEGGPKIGDAVVIDGAKHRIRRMDETVDLSIAGGHWQQRSIVKSLGSESALVWDDTADVWRVEPATAAAAAAPESVVTFLDPQDNKTPIRSRVVLVEADDLLTSDEPGFPPTLQPRSRGVRASSAEQVQEYAADIQPDKLIGTTEGSQGMPVVSPDGAVVAGNGRTMALRIADTMQYGKYRTRIQAEALKHGFTVEDVNAMRRPMLVRELVDVDPATMERLAWQLNEMPVGDLAPSVAAALTRSDIREFKVGDDQSLADAIRSPANTGAVARMIGRLPRDWHARFFDPKTGLNEPGARLLEAALISKLLRADDRGAPGFEAARAVVFQIAEQGAEDIRRIGNGLAEGTAQVVKAYELAESGAITPDILTFGSDLAPALARIIELRDTGLNMEGVRNALDNTTMFEAMTLTPQQTHLAKLLASSETQREVRTFMRAVAKAAEDGPVAGQEAMFADVPQVDYTGLLNEGVKAWNETRKAAGKSEIDYFPSTEAPYDIPLTTKAVTENAIGQTQGPARMTQPLAPEEVDAEVASRTIGEAMDEITGDPLEDKIRAAAREDFDALNNDVNDVVDDFQKFAARGTEQEFYDAMLEAANLGELTAGEALVLRHLAGGLVRRTASGKFNMPMAAKLARGALQAELDTFARDVGREAPGSLSLRPKVDLAPGYYRDGPAGEIGTRTYYVDEQGRAEMVSAGRTVEGDQTVVHAVPGPAGVPEVRLSDPALESKAWDKAWRAWKKAEAEATETDYEFRNAIETGLRGKVIRPATQKPITAAELAADVGPDVPIDVPVAAVDEAIAAGEHVVVVGDNPTVNRAVRRAVGAPAVEDNKRRVIEVNAPDGKAAAEILEAARLEASAALQRAEAEAQAMRDGPPPERQVASVFPDAKLRDMWDRLMRGSDVDELAAAVGSTEPTSLAEVMDAIQSIDRGVYGDPNTGVGLTPDEAMVLRSHLMRLANGTLENAITRKGVRQTARATAKLGKPPDDFDAAELQDRAAQLMDEAGSFVQVDPNAPPLEGFMGAQYVLAKPPTKEKGTNRALPPRLLFTDRFAGDVVPGLLEELEVGRMEDVPRRIANARVARLLDTAIGPRPEQQIRSKAIANFKEELSRYIDEDLNRDAAKKMDDVVELAYDKWRDHMEKTKPVAGFQLFRRIHLIGPQALDQMFMEAVTDVYGAEAPSWVHAMTADGKTPSQLWRRADNRMRRWLSESGLPLSEQLEALYGKVADAGEPGARTLTVIYHFGRFLMDVRWLGLEAVEPLMLTLPRGGLGPVLEASVARKSARLLRITDKMGLTRSKEKPLAFGVDQRQLMFREFAHWANVQDIEQGTAVRHRYLVRELMREQQRPIKDIVTQMMRDEPQLRRLVEEADGGDVNAFLRRLDRDWQLAERGTKKFQTNAQAAEFFRRWLDDGVIDEQTYKEFVDAKSYTASPAIEAELAKVVNDPFATAMYERLAAINQDLFHNLTATFFGQENRSNLQRLANHPLLFWPISYQIKATKWLMRMMLEEFGGVDTGATVAGVFQHVHDEHRRRFATDPRYRANYTSNKTLYFLAGMLLPIIPTEVGVSMSPWTRMMLYPEYERANGIWGVGPIYTNLSLIPRLIAEQQKPGGLLYSAPAEANDALSRAFPQTITVGGTRKKPTSEINAEQQRLLPPSPEPIPPAPLTTVREP